MPEKTITVTLGSGEPVEAASKQEKRLIEERDAFAELAGWDFESDGEHRVPWDFERVKRQCLERQREDAALATPTQPEPCDCDPDGHVAADCEDNGCRAARTAQPEHLLEQ